MISTYSFQDVAFTISHPSVGQYIASGEGIGSLNVSFADDRTVHEQAADGSVMISKIKTRKGTLALQIQQTSPLNKWLQKWFNYLETASTEQWAQTKIIIRAPRLGEQITALSVSPQKPADSPYQAQGQNVTWSVMAADIQKDII